ncbi:TonB family protein [Psychrobacter sp. M9-54-1]|uniref:energy transducer TonB n=1 Tax=Psychrobacter sp. M9-54-1 TaxID=2782386 RepID=UPI00190D2503|nr:energy transducer TonB [Psychrobacter sp. M9-54-1]MBK3394109.1 TonB family protein [Psychrobacter sp. M9-54-1]
MSSTDLEAPPLRLILIAIILVVGLHLLTAIALVIIKAPTLKDESIKETPPLEIQMVTLPTQPIENVVTEVEEVPQSKAESIPTSKPEPKPEPKTQQKMKAVTPVDPVVREEEPIVQKEKPVQTPPIKEPPVKKKIEDKPPVIDKSVADEQRRIIAAQAEKTAQQAERQAQAKALQEAQAQAARDAQAQADANAAKEAAQKAAQAKAEREAEAAARAKAEAAAKAAAAASNEPVNFTASAANWASAPNFSFPDRAARRARSGDTLNVVLVLRVNKQGGIDSIRVAQSSGNPLLDKEAQRQVRSGKFKPFTKNGAPVVGNVTLPIAYAVP